MKNYLYLVEGDDEKNLVDYLRNKPKLIYSGKTKVFNVFTKEISNALLRTFKDNTIVIFVFDTDLPNPNLKLFQKNFDKLKSSPKVKDIVLIPQCKNLEDEIIRSTSINRIIDFFPSENIAKFKSTFAKATYEVLRDRFDKNSFDFSLMWSKRPDGSYKMIENQSDKIKQ